LVYNPRAFQKPFEDGVALLNAIQDLYLDKTIDIA
jgi:class I fructose-bisphosphate aldolase